MEPFVIHNPVKLHFGPGVAGKTGSHARQLGNKALLMLGRGSALKNGAYGQVTASLKESGVDWVEYRGIKSNPTLEGVDGAAALGREHGANLVIALGGGSVVDSAKMAAITIPVDHSAWEFMDGSQKPGRALPLLAVVTLAATGSEMNHYAVIQNDVLKMKKGYGHPLLFPRHSYLDPLLTVSVPPDYTAFGIADLVAHCLEAWFGEGEASLSDRLTLSIIREALEYGPQLMAHPEDAGLRARIMYAATCALNGMTVPGRKSADWGVHAIGHCLSAFWDIPHGASLTVAYPAWLELQEERIPGRIAALGKELFGLDGAGETTRALRDFFQAIGCPVSLHELHIHPTKKEKEELFGVMRRNKVDGLAHRLAQDDYRRLIDRMC
jgi:hypothetical protein